MRAYAVRGDLTAVARNHASRMAARRSYYHNPNLGSEVSGWQAVAENVGKGSDAGSLHRAFMASSGHRRNILSSTYTEVGVGTATDSGGTLYVVQIFRLPSGGSSYRAPAPAPTARASSTGTRVRVPARASRSARRPVVVARRWPPRNVLLRMRLKQAGGWYDRTDRASAVQRLLLFHDIAVFVAHGVPR